MNPRWRFRGQIEGEGFNLAIGGRIDGVLRSDDRVCVEEIKTTRIAFKDLEDEPNPIHWGQAICYAYLLARQESLPGVDVRLTYVHTDPWREKSFIRPMTSAELTDFFNDVVLRYMKWISQIVGLAWDQGCQPAAHDLSLWCLSPRTASHGR